MKVSTLLGLVTAASLALSGCGGAAARPSTSSQSAAAAAQPSVTAGVRGSVSPASSAAGAPAAASAGAGPVKLVVSYSAPSADQMVAWVAKDSGVFEKNGLDVDLRLIDSSPGISALLAGETQMAAIGGLEVLNAVAGGADLEILATLTPVYSFKFEVPASVKTKDDLKGKKVGISRFGSSTEAAARAGLKKIGIDPDKDVTLVQIGGLGALEAALANGAIQGGPDQPPSAYVLETKGFHPLFDLATLKLPFATAVLAAKRSWVNDHHDVVQKMVDSLVQATAIERQNRGLATAVIKKYLKVDNQAALDATYDYYVKEVHPVYPYPRTEQFTDALTLMGAKNPALKSFDVASALAPQFVKSAEDRKLGG